MPLSRLMRQMTLFQNPVKYHSRCVQTSTFFLCTSVTAIWPNWNVEARCSTSLWLEQLQMIQFFHSVTLHMGRQQPVSQSCCAQCRFHNHLVCVWLLTGPLLPQPIALCSLLFSFGHWCVCIYCMTLLSLLFFLLFNSLSNGRFFPDSVCLQPLILARLHPAVDRMSTIWSSGFVISKCTYWQLYMSPSDNPFQTVLIEISLIR